jgi:hypothetical protein
MPTPLTALTGTNAISFEKSLTRQNASEVNPSSDREPKTLYTLLSRSS